ncbi:MAG: zinc-ribbon domain-containing protein, partial [Thermoplasmata archaeon]|nr:zinc-ribbon domain-containing protein [Thermoplasmata archaeon]
MGDENRIVCPHCEAKLEADSRFCNYCGHSIAETWEKGTPRRKSGPGVAKKRALLLISSVEKALRAARKSGAEVASIHVALDHVRRIMSEGNFEEAESKAKILLRKSKEANERRKKELTILNARLIVDKARELGADVNAAYDLVKKAETALDNGIYGDVVEFVRKARKEATEAKRKRRARQMILNFKPKLDYAYEIGADVDVAKEYFRSAEEALERTVYGEVQEYLKLARTEVNEVKRFKRASGLVENAEKSLHSARATGADAGEVEETIRQAKRALQKREFDDVKALTKDARKQANQAMRRKEMESSLESMCQEIEYIKSIEVDITRAEGIAAKAREALEKGDNARARRYVSQLRTWLTKEKRKLGATDEDIPIQMLGVSKRLRDIREIVDEIRKVGVDISYVEDLFEEARQAFQERDIAKSENILSEIEEMALGLKESLTIAAKDLLEKAKKEAEEARKENLNIGSAGETVRNGLRALEEGHIDEALQYAEIARNLVDRAKKERVVDLAKGSLLRMEVIITDSKKVGLSVEEAETLYRKASDDFEKGEFEKVEAYVPKVDLSAKKAKRLYITTKAQDELEGASFAIDDVERLGAEVSEAKGLLKQAREALFDENY